MAKSKAKAATSRKKAKAGKASKGKAPKTEAVFLLRLDKASKLLGGKKNGTFGSRAEAERLLKRVGVDKGRVQLWNRPVQAKA